MKRLHFKVMYLLLFVCSFALLGQPAAAGLTFVSEGVSAKDVPVRFEAELAISGDMLTIVLTNNSPVDSLNPDDLLGSFYFDIVNAAGDRPVLTYVSAVGDTYKGVKDGSDIMLEAGANLQALSAGDNSWQFKELDVDYIPNLRYGIGTVGNNNLFPNGFNGNIVGSVDFAIYKGEIATQSLTNPDVLVKETATFVFSGLTGFSEDDIVDDFAFGLGTAPDSLLTPEPATVVLLGLGGVLLRRRK